MADVRGAPARSLEATFVVPAGIDDPDRPSGGNRYDRQVVAALAERGWRVTEEHGPVATGRGVPVVVDGLVGLRDPARYAGAVVLLHMPFAQAHPELAAAERVLLHGAAAVVTTSAWAREWVVAHHGLDPRRVHVATPGVGPVPLTTPSPGGGRLLCVGAVTRPKGYDVLLAALERVADLAWTCTCAGTLALDPSVGEELRASAVADRLDLRGPLAAPPYDAADLLVAPSRHESFGMAVTEALAHGVPVLASDVGGHPEALGEGGQLVPAGDPDALAAALRRWLTDPGVRSGLRAAAARRRTSLRSWSDTAADLEAVLR